MFGIKSSFRIGICFEVLQSFLKEIKENLKIFQLKKSSKLCCLLEYQKLHIKQNVQLKINRKLFANISTTTFSHSRLLMLALILFYSTKYGSNFREKAVNFLRGTSIKFMTNRQAVYIVRSLSAAPLIIRRASNEAQQRIYGLSLKLSTSAIILRFRKGRLLSYAKSPESRESARLTLFSRVILNFGIRSELLPFELLSILSLLILSIPFSFSLSSCKGKLLSIFSSGVFEVV